MNSTKRINILLVEDDPADAEMIISALSKRSLHKGLHHAEDGAEAMELLFDPKGAVQPFVHLPKVIILDLKMPRINGMEVLRRIKSEEKTRHIPVVIFSSSMEDSDLINSYRLGVSSYIVKPVKFSDFTQTISDVAHYWLQLNQLPH